MGDGRVACKEARLMFLGFVSIYELVTDLWVAYHFHTTGDDYFLAFTVACVMVANTAAAIVSARFQQLTLHRGGSGAPFMAVLGFINLAPTVYSLRGRSDAAFGVKIAQVVFEAAPMSVFLFYLCLKDGVEAVFLFSLVGSLISMAIAVCQFDFHQLREQCIPVAVTSPKFITLFVWRALEVASRCLTIVLVTLAFRFWVLILVVDVVALFLMSTAPNMLVRAVSSFFAVFVYVAYPHMGHRDQQCECDFKRMQTAFSATLYAGLRSFELVIVMAVVYWAGDLVVSTSWVFVAVGIHVVQVLLLCCVSSFWRMSGSMKRRAEKKKRWMSWLRQLKNQMIKRKDRYKMRDEKKEWFKSWKLQVTMISKDTFRRLMHPRKIRKLNKHAWEECERDLAKLKKLRETIWHDPYTFNAGNLANAGSDLDQSIAAPDQTLRETLGVTMADTVNESSKGVAPVVLDVLPSKTNYKDSTQHESEESGEEKDDKAVVVDMEGWVATDAGLTGFRMETEGEKDDDENVVVEGETVNPLNVSTPGRFVRSFNNTTKSDPAQKDDTLKGLSPAQKVRQVARDNLAASKNKDADSFRKSSSSKKEKKKKKSSKSRGRSSSREPKKERRRSSSRSESRTPPPVESATEDSDSSLSGVDLSVLDEKIETGPVLSSTPTRKSSKSAMRGRKSKESMTRKSSKSKERSRSRKRVDEDGDDKRKKRKSRRKSEEPFAVSERFEEDPAKRRHTSRAYRKEREDKERRRKKHLRKSTSAAPGSMSRAKRHSRRDRDGDRDDEDYHLGGRDVRKSRGHSANN